MSGLPLTDAIVDPAGRTLAGRDDSGLVVVDLAGKTARRLEVAKEARPVAFGKDARRSRGGAPAVPLLSRASIWRMGRLTSSQIPMNETAGLAESITMQLAPRRRHLCLFTIAERVDALRSVGLEVELRRAGWPPEVIMKA